MLRVQTALPPTGNRVRASDEIGTRKIKCSPLRIIVCLGKTKTVGTTETATSSIGVTLKHLCPVENLRLLELEPSVGWSSREDHLSV